MVSLEVLAFVAIFVCFSIAAPTEGEYNIAAAFKILSCLFAALQLCSDTEFQLIHVCVDSSLGI